VLDDVSSLPDLPAPVSTSAAAPSPAASIEKAAASQRLGAIVGTAAFLWWGVAPLYFRKVDDFASSAEILCHRVVWSVAFLAIVITWRGAWGAVKAALRPRLVGIFAITTSLIAVNWFGFIYAIQTGHLKQASIAYYITPLMNVLAGWLVDGDRLRPLQKAAVASAAVGVAILVVAEGHVPWLALLMAVTWTAYATLRKRTPVDSVTGLSVETGLVTPIALGALAMFAMEGRCAFTSGRPDQSLWLMLAGPITALPLLWHVFAAQRLPLATLGMLQYLSPTLQFLIAVKTGEPMGTPDVICFACIWTGVAVFCADAWRKGRLPR
jgi:chloramphenicol-sensitive protein RarD